MTIETANSVSTPKRVRITTIEATGWRRLHARTERRAPSGPEPALCCCAAVVTRRFLPQSDRVPRVHAYGRHHDIPRVLEVQLVDRCPGAGCHDAAAVLGAAPRSRPRK